MRRNWGATAAEATAVLPGDELVPEPAEITTLAVGIAAPPERVWAWLVQIGQGRGGMYSYDWLENLLSFQIHSADEIREEWQRRAVGARVVVVRAGYPAMPDGYFFTVAQVEPPRTLVLRQAPPEHPWNGVWSFRVVPASPAAAGCSRAPARRSTSRPAASTMLSSPVLVAGLPLRSRCKAKSKRRI